MTRRENAATKATVDMFHRALGHRLHVTRIALGISEKEAAKAFAVSLPTYRKYELGEPMKGGLGTLKFARKYDVKLDWLLCGDTFGLPRHLTTGKVAILPVKGAHYRENVQKYNAALLRAEMWRRMIMPSDSRGPLDAA